jgi:hypothetical protein
LVATEFSARSAGSAPGEVAGTPSPGPGFSPDWVAAAIERCLVLPGRDVVSVPRILGATRIVKLPGLRHVTDLVLAANAERISRLGRRIAADDAGTAVR